MSELIIYGGAFNPPTKGHLEIIKYLLNRFPNNKLVILPTNNYYKSNEIVSFKNRKEMLEIMCKDFLDKIVISDYEQTLDRYYGTYYTLEHFNHPYFVIGADSLESLKSWINYPSVLVDNKFIVFPRNNFDINSYIKNDEILSKHQNIIVCADFKEIDVSSTSYRTLYDKAVVTEEVEKYIIENNLYKED